jgi:hypothetical protein
MVRNICFKNLFSRLLSTFRKICLHHQDWIQSKKVVQAQIFVTWYGSFTGTQIKRESFHVILHTYDFKKMSKRPF